MMPLDRLIKRILSAKPELTQEAVLGLIKEKMAEASDLLTDEGAAYVVAAELGVSISEGERLETEIRLDDLIPGTRDVSIAGRVLTVYPIQRFTRKDGVEGRVGRLILADRTGVVNVVLWDEKADLISQGRLARGQIIRVTHAYVREGLDGNPEVNVGSKGQVTISSSENVEDFPHLRDFFKKIGELRDKENNVNVTGIIDDITPTSTFQREERVGRVTRVKLMDETGEAWAVFWNEMTESLANARRGDRIEIMNARTRRNIQDSLELHVGRRTQVTISTEKREGTGPHTIKLSKISELKNTSKNVSVQAKVVRTNPVKEFKRPSGETGKVASIDIEDETGKIMLVLWGEHADVVNKLSINDIVTVQNAYVKDGLQGSIELNLGRLGKITVNRRPSSSGTSAKSDLGEK